MNDTLKQVEAGKFFLIAGPCAAESEQLCLDVAEKVAALADKFCLPYIFKSSFTKANRTSAGSYTGPGLDEGLRILQKVKDEFDLPVLTDIHETNQIEAVAQVADILQIPAFLCRQTNLIEQAAATGKWINIKKGQFLAPDDMAKTAAKANSNKIMLTERGSTFGYHNLVVDFRALLIMRETGHKIVFDATHSLQLPGGGGAVSAGQPQLVIPMARAAAAIGIDGLFVETHPNPSEALCDASVMLPLNQMEKLLASVTKIREALK
ncbi:MAG: 3-deoxy-8-phosphooctulonate synthase [candidate division Zixibacteria bacterium]|nr:3-deoxy-8-phosphooctulonate synthase [candidate division Zixibacteria bacterium]